jgi:eukaryotic-like serine/threonine-protein kinase
MSDDPYLQLTGVGRCQVLAKIGQGGMGVVYRGRHKDLDLDVAIKFLHPDRLRGSDGAQRFLREARLAVRFNHPGVVRVFDCGETRGHYFIIMEFVDGQSLAAHIDERRLVPVARSLQIAESVARALDYALDQVGVIHRDIKPANILLTSGGEVKLADLGLAKVVVPAEITATYAAGHTSPGIALGTPHYMSPEQFDDASQVDHRADIFSLGATLYHMLSGTTPFKGDSVLSLLKQVVETDPAPLPSHVPIQVEELVSRMMAKRPAERFQTYEELLEALLAAQAGPANGETDIAAGVTPSMPSIIPAAKTAGKVIRSATPTENRALLVVDIQRDFCPTGALAVPEGDQVVPIINKLSRRFAHVILTQDWHCEDHLSFASSHPGMKRFDRIILPYGPQILWPDHCVQGTRGAEFHPDLRVDHCELIIRKGYHREIDSYSAFFENDRQTPTGLAGYLRERGLTRLFIAGLATDFCVAYSAIDARRLGFEVTVIESACRGIDVDGSLKAAWDQMLEAGVIRA